MTLRVVLSLIFCLYVASAQIPVINNGNDKTPISHLQYIASLQLVSTEEQFFCAGVFISPRAVLTLATCFYQNDVLLQPEEVRIVAGSQFRLDKSQNTFTSGLEEIHIHENFSRISLENNLAVAYTSLNIPEDSVTFVDLEDIAINPPVEGAKCQIFGWSLTTRYGGSPHLLSDDVDIEDTEKCDISYTKMTSTTICAGPYFVDGCESDDGSPLVCRHKLFGLVGYRAPGYCSMVITNRLGTYVDLSAFHDWIAERSGSTRIIFKTIMLLLSAFVIKILS